MLVQSSTIRRTNSERIVGYDDQIQKHLNNKRQWDIHKDIEHAVAFTTTITENDYVIMMWPRQGHNSSKDLHWERDDEVEESLIVYMAKFYIANTGPQFSACTT